MTPDGPRLTDPTDRPGLEMIYLDNNATTAIDPRVATAIDECHRWGPANPSSQHRLGREARCRLDEAIESIGHSLGTELGLPGGPRLVLTSGGTEANNLAILGIGEPDGPLVISEIEHPSVSVAAEQAAAQGREVRRIPVNRSGIIELQKLEDAVRRGPRPALASLMSANNETGVLQPIEAAAAICRDAGVPLHVDASQSFGRVPVDLAAWSAAAVTISPHKFHGPVGVGGLWLAAGLSPRPGLFGGGQQLGLRPGTEPLHLVVGMSVALRHAVQEQPSAHRHQQELRDRFESELTRRHGHWVIQGGKAPRLPGTSSLSMIGADRQSLLMALDFAGIACSSGAACSSGSSPPSHVLMAMGVPPGQLTSTLRFGLSKFSTAEEIETAIEAISRCYLKLRGVSAVEN